MLKTKRTDFDLERQKSHVVQVELSPLNLQTHVELVTALQVCRGEYLSAMAHLYENYSPVSSEKVAKRLPNTLFELNGFSSLEEYKIFRSSAAAAVRLAAHRYFTYNLPIGHIEPNCIPLTVNTGDSIEHKFTPNYLKHRDFDLIPHSGIGEGYIRKNTQAAIFIDTSSNKFYFRAWKLQSPERPAYLYDSVDSLQRKVGEPLRMFRAEDARDPKHVRFQSAWGHEVTTDMPICRQLELIRRSYPIPPAIVIDPKGMNRNVLKEISSSAKRLGGIILEK